MYIVTFKKDRGNCLTRRRRRPVLTACEFQSDNLRGERRLFFLFENSEHDRFSCRTAENSIRDIFPLKFRKNRRTHWLQHDNRRKTIFRNRRFRTRRAQQPRLVTSWKFEHAFYRHEPGLSVRGHFANNRFFHRWVFRGLFLLGFLVVVAQTLLSILQKAQP